MPILVYIFISILILSFLILKYSRSSIGKVKFIFEYIIFFLYLSSLAIFVISFLLKGYTSYQEAIDPVDESYSPFADKHWLTLLTYFILGSISSFQIWTKGRKLPPLFLVSCIVMMLIEAFICIPVIFQFSYNHDNENFNVGGSDNIFLMLAPVMTIIIVILLILKVIFEEAKCSENRQFNNKILNLINEKLASSKNLAVWVILLLIPVYLIMTMLLLLIGQDHDSIVKVFTETTTWKFSQYSHPPYLEHHGHYLCTVAASGHNKIVKPLRLGTRKGSTIIVNRQLLIANAFEELISDHFPKVHRWIRKNYDKYGYPLSKKINTPFKADLIYILMKPIEFMFLIILYLLCLEPEKMINKQYL
ncbi:MAG: DUF6688 family protein [Spirochaetota bacterium]